MGPNLAFIVCVCVCVCGAFSVFYLFSSFFVHSSFLACFFHLFLFLLLYFTYRSTKAFYMFPLICKRNDESNVSAIRPETEDCVIILYLDGLQ
jgi:amino acid permease